MVLTAAIAALPLYGCGADQTTSGVVCPQVWKNETKRPLGLFVDILCV